MLAKRIIPCLDVRNGKVVKGVNFEGIKDVGDPVECAYAYNQQGADEIVFYDITASYEGRGVMLDVVRKTAKKVFVPLTVAAASKQWTISVTRSVPVQIKCLSIPRQCRIRSSSKMVQTFSAASASAWA